MEARVGFEPTWRLTRPLPRAKGLPSTARPTRLETILVRLKDRLTFKGLADMVTCVLNLSWSN